MSSLQYRKRLHIQDLPPSAATVKKVRTYFYYCLLWSAIGVAAIGVQAYFFGWKSILGAVIALPPAILCGNTWVQVLRKHPEWINGNYSLFRVLSRSRKLEPALFWLGIVGAAGVCGLTYFLAGFPEATTVSWLYEGSFFYEIPGVFTMMLGCSALPLAYYLRKRIKAWLSTERVSAQLAASFLQEYEYHKN